MGNGSRIKSTCSLPYTSAIACLAECRPNLEQLVFPSWYDLNASILWPQAWSH